MDPFIEGQRWRDFHTRFITVLGEMLTPQVRPRYVVAIEEYVYLIREEEEDPQRLIEPDLSVVETCSPAERNHGSPAGVASPIAPVLHTVPVPKRYRQTFLTLCERQSQNVVTVLELLSPWNKTAGEGQTEYLVKRSNVFCTPAHLLELDLLRGGRRLPTLEPLEPADFYAFVCRKEQLPQVEVYGWTLRQPLPVVPIPLAGSDPDVPLDLQAAFTSTYDRAGYDYALDYRLPVEPGLDSPTAEWARSILCGIE
jgi:hypothetical protein